MKPLILSPLTALSPLDGRYHAQLDGLRPCFSEYALIRYRCLVEVRWLIQLANSPHVDVDITSQAQQQLLDWVERFSLADAEAVKTIEETTRHDVKAVEYFLRQKLSALQLERLIPLLHFGCTSEDINNLAYALMFKSASEFVLLPAMHAVIQQLRTLAQATAHLPMLARTHGQAASPTVLGKELFNVVCRLDRQYQQWADQTIFGKCNGAVGNFNAHHIAFPEVDWPAMSETFVRGLGLTWSAYTTQIEPHDWIAESMQVLQRFNTVLIDLNRDLWGYISLDYFSQRTTVGEVGSSTMPHKVNPIDFENSEGNLGVANALAQHLAEKLPVSRWQRDLSDSTVLRNLGSVLAYALKAYQSTFKGLQRLVPNEAALHADLDAHWEVLAEAIQSTMRRYGIADAYEQLKHFSRGRPLDADRCRHFIRQLDIPEAAKTRLLALTPETYTGCAFALLEKGLAEATAVRQAESP